MPMSVVKKTVYVILGLGLTLLTLGITFLFINWIVSVVLWVVMFVIHIAYYYYLMIKAKMQNLQLGPSANGDCVIFLFAVVYTFVIVNSVSIILL